MRVSPVVAVTALLVVVGAATVACTKVLDGSPVSVGEPLLPTTTTKITSSRPTTSAPSDPSVAPSTQASNNPLVTNVVENECLLDAVEFSALLGKQAREGKNLSAQNNGQESRSCYYYVEDGFAPVGSINVYMSNAAPPPDLIQRILQVPDARSVANVGRGAAVVPDEQGAPGADMWLATEQYLVVINLDDDRPDDDRWAVAGRAAVERVPA